MPVAIPKTQTVVQPSRTRTMYTLIVSTVMEPRNRGPSRCERSKEPRATVILGSPSRKKEKPDGPEDPGRTDDGPRRYLSVNKRGCRVQGSGSLIIKRKEC